jgi:hypothetical protein
MGIGSYKEAQRYRMRTNKNLTRTFYLDTKRTLDQEPFAWEQVQNTPIPETDYNTEVDPGMVVPPQDVLPKNPIPNMSSAPGIPDPQFRQLELANGGRVNFSEGSKLTGTDKTLEQNIKDDHKAFNNYRKSIGSPTVPLDNKYIQMWIRTRLSSGGSVKKETPKFIPMDLESVAFRLFQDNLDNLSYNQKQTVYNYIEDNRNKKAEGGRVKLQNGSDDSYYQEIPTLASADPIDILEQQLINEKDPIKIEILKNELNQIKEELIAKETAREEEKRSQKEKGVKYKEDFPSDAAYFLETGKQLLTNPKYTLGKLGKGVVEGTEWLGGQFGKTVLGMGEFDPSKSALENALYESVAGEKLGINKFIEKNIPKDPTTGTLMGGEALEIAGSFLGPFEIYQLMKGAQTPKALEKKLSTIKIDETIDPTRRDILKTGAVMGGGALLYPTAKKLGIFDELAKGAKVAARVLPKVKGMPEWFSPLVSRIQREGLDITAQAREVRKKTYTPIKGVPEDKDFGIVQSRKIEIPVAGKKEPEIITMTEYKNGDIYIESNISGGAFDSPYDLYYSSPKEVMETKYVRDQEGNLVESQFKVKKEGDFRIEEQRPGYTYAGRYYDESPDVELDYTDVSFENSISDLERLEEIATGKKPDPKKIKERKEYREYVQKNPKDDADSRLPDPDPDYDYGSYIKEND